MKDENKNRHRRPFRPSEWSSGELVVNRQFNLESSPDVACLIRLVKDGLKTCQGNEGILKARLLGTLLSIESRLFYKNHLMNSYPKTWWFRYKWHYAKKAYNRYFNTRKHRGEVYMYDLCAEVVKEYKEENNVG